MDEKNENIRLSVCVVTYNHEKYISQALDSFLMQQTNFKFQIIVGDDASTDRTTEIIKEYALKYPDVIKHLLHEKNIGSFNNSMSVYNAAKTEYVAICDGDDYWCNKNKLQEQVDFLDKNKNCSICYHNTKIIFSDKFSTDIIWPSPEYRFNKTVLTIEDLSIRNPMHTSSLVYRWRFKDENIRTYFKENVCPGDYFLALLHAEKGNIGFINKIMSIYRKHGEGMSADLSTREDKVWLKYGLQELRFHKYIDLHFQYKLARYFRYEKIKKCVKVLETYIQNNAFDKLDAFKTEFPEYYELGQEYRYDPAYNKYVSPIPIPIADDFKNKIKKDIRKLKSRQRLLLWSYILLMIALIFLYFKG